MTQTVLNDSTACSDASWWRLTDEKMVVLFGVLPTLNVFLYK
jgi:hypothetical protein